MRLTPVLTVTLGFFLVFLAAGCNKTNPDRITVLAASSLTEALPRVTTNAYYSFGGSDFIAAQVRENVPADVFISANARYADDLEAEGLLEEVRVVVRNHLVIVVQEGNPLGISNLVDLASPEVRFVVAAPTVPAGEYTRVAFEELGLSVLLESVVSNENDVKAVVGKIALGEADAGIAYATDIQPLKDKVESLPLPIKGQPNIEYRGGIIASSSRKGAARFFLDMLESEVGKSTFLNAGFDLP